MRSAVSQLASVVAPDASRETGLRAVPGGKSMSIYRLESIVTLTVLYRKIETQRVELNITQKHFKSVLFSDKSTKCSFKMMEFEDI